MNRGPFSSNRSGVKSGFLSRGALRLPDWSGRSCSAPRSCWFGLGDEPCVGAERGGGKAQPALRPIQQGQTARLLRYAALEDLHREAEQQAVAVLHRRIDGVAGVGALPDVPFETNRQSRSVRDR